MVSRRRVLKVAAVAAGSLTAAAAAGSAGAAAVFETSYGDRFYPGVWVGGHDLSGLTWDEALARLDAAWRPLLVEPLVIRLDGREWRPGAAEIGISVDYVSPLREAYRWGRTGGISRRIGEQAALARSTRQWPVRTRFDDAKLSAYLDALSASLHQEPSPAAIQIADQGVTRSLLIQPSSDGREVANLDQLKTFVPDFTSPKSELFELDVRPLHPSADTDQMRRVAASARSMLTGEVTLFGGDRVWRIDRSTLSNRLIFRDTAQGPQPFLHVVPSDFAPLVSEIAGALKRPPVEPKLRFNPAGQALTFVTPPQNGAEVDTDALWTRIQDALHSDSSALAVPIKTVEPVLARATPASLGLNWLYGFGESYFRGSAQYRIHNIQVGSAKLDGIILEPGESFDFNEALGPVTYETGYVDGLIIINDRTLPGVGGGLCQVSTTMFRAAFRAGLPIAERWQHLYRVSYYEQGEGNPPGFDASVYQPALNLKFVNDTGAYLMIKTEFDRAKARLRFSFMGDAQRRQVKMTSWRGEAVPPPTTRAIPNPKFKPGQREQVEYAIAGMKTSIGRQVWAADKLLYEDRFDSNFIPWPDIWEIGPDEKGNLDTTGIKGL